MPIETLVLITGFCAIASLSNPALGILPALLALLSPSDPVPAAFTACVAVVLTSFMVQFLSKSR